MSDWKVGDRVRVMLHVIEGVIEETNGTWILVKHPGGARWISPAEGTWERLSRPEPEWETDDLILSDGTCLRRLPGGMWRSETGSRYDGELLPRPLIPLARNGKPWAEAGVS